MVKNSKPKKKLSDQKNNSINTFSNRNDLFCGEELYELTEKLRLLEKEHLQRTQNVDSLYCDIHNGETYFMFMVQNSEEIALLSEIIKIRRKINSILEGVKINDGRKKQ